MEPSEGLPKSLRDRLRDQRAWGRVGQAYLSEWRMVWKELIVGFTVAGAIADLVPDRVFQALFPQGDSSWLLPLQALMAPVLAVVTFIGSVGNGPVAAILAEEGIVFGAIMTFLYADFVVPPALKINANYYGWRCAAYLAAVFAAAAVVAGIAVHAIFAVIGLLPSAARSLEELAAFKVDYTLVLNLVALAVAIALVILARRSPSPESTTRRDRRPPPERDAR